MNESRSVMSNSLRPHRLYSPWNSPGKNTGVGTLSLLQGIFPTQGSNPGLPHCRRIFYQLSYLIILFGHSSALTFPLLQIGALHCQQGADSHSLSATALFSTKIKLKFKNGKTGYGQALTKAVLLLTIHLLLKQSQLSKVPISL